MTTPDDDPVIKQFRDLISDNDLRIVEAVNKRLELVRQLWQYKAAKGIGRLSPEREEWMLTFVTRANKGPLSPEGLRDVYRTIVEVTKREAGSAEEPELPPTSSP